ncbi:hypothetical protein WJX72_005607 [[Myrmecia] bisecta]|uniref:F-box domain-containing protein n=1 Tax=[Myrmecia] bisecta TaxID=41462 RepID=A0AAW1P3I4_9CHLO
MDLFKDVTRKTAHQGSHTDINSQEAVWSTLPADLVRKVFVELPQPTKRAGRLVCTSWCEAISAGVIKLRYQPHAYRPLSRVFQAVRHVDLGDRLTTTGQVLFARLLRSLPRLTGLAGKPKFEDCGSLSPTELLQALHDAQPDVALSLDFVSTHANSQADVGIVLQEAATRLTSIFGCPRDLLLSEDGKHLRSLTALQGLGCQFAVNYPRPVSLAPLGRLTQLVRLHLNGQAKTSSLMALSTLTNLTELVWPLGFFTKQKETKLPQLATLKLQKCNAWTNNGMEGLAAKLPAIQHISLQTLKADKVAFNDTGVCALSKCSNLQTLELRTSVLRDPTGAAGVTRCRSGFPRIKPGMGGGGLSICIAGRQLDSSPPVHNDQARP